MLVNVHIPDAMAVSGARVDRKIAAFMRHSVAGR